MGASTSLAFLLLSAPALAGAGPPRLGQTFDASLGLAPERATAAVSWNHLFAVLPGRLELGLGARLTTLYARGPLVFRTGDPDLVRAGRTNRFIPRDPWVTSLNAQLLAVLKLFGPLEAGFDIDLVGFSFGPSRTGDYEPTDPAFDGPPRRARVSSFDLLLFDIRDRGQLNSEFFLGYRLDPDWTLRAGLSHVATEYRTVEPLDGGNRRFRRFTNQLFLGVSRRLR